MAAHMLQLGKVLLLAAKNGDYDTVINMMNQSAPFVNDWLGTSPLHFACQNNHAKIVEILLRSGISKDARTKVDKTPLHFAACHGHFEIVEMLLKQGADPNTLDMLGMTALHWTCENQHLKCTKALLEYGADPSIINKFGKTAEKLAFDHGRYDIVSAIQEASSLVDEPKKPDIALHTGISEINSLSVIVSPKNTESQLDETKLSPSSYSDSSPTCSTSVNQETDLKTDPEKYSLPGKVSSTPAHKSVKRKKSQSPDALSFFTDSGVVPLSSADQAETLQLLESHGITMLPADDYTIVASAVKSGHTVCLTEAGKMALRSIEMSVAPSPSLPLDKSISSSISQTSSHKKQLQGAPSRQIVKINSVEIGDKNSEGKRVIKIHANQLNNLRKKIKAHHQATINKPTEKSSKVIDSSIGVNDALLLAEEIDEASFAEAISQLEAAQELVKIYRQQLINKETELLLYKRLLAKKDQELKLLKRKPSKPSAFS